jgi:4-hydroxy-3-polyprenylbenzoate decarboxylase
MTAPIQDLRDAIALLQQHDNQYLETDHPVDPNAELAGVYRHIGAGGTVKRPTRIGPAMMFNNIKGYPHSRILVGMHASRQRAALLLGCEASQLALEVGKAVKKPVAPVVVPASSAPCQEQIFLADDPDFDLRTLLPAPTNTPIDAGPFFCLGLALASDPDDASLTDVTIHRLCVQGRDELSMFLAAGRHIEVFRQKAEAAGKPLPITINMGLDPAIYIGACFEAPPRRLAITNWASPARCVSVRWSWCRASASRRKPSPAPRSLLKANCCRACASERISTPTAATRCRNFPATAAAPIRRCR